MSRGSKKNLVSTLPHANRLALIEREAGELSLVVQAELLGLSRASIYYRRVPPSAQEIGIKRRMDELYTAHPFYGSRRLSVCLQREGLCINRKAVQRYMHEMGIVAICPGPNLSKRELAHRVYPYLLRGVRAASPDHIWGIDITYIRLVAGWLYLVAVLDWYSRYVISWELSDSLAIEFVLAAVDSALQRSTPQIWNSDQGSHFTSPHYIERLQAAQVQISMDGKGRALDNIFTERLWRSIKYEEVYLHDYTTPRNARQGLTRYLEFYNHERPHQALNYQTPAELYSGACLAIQLADRLTLKGAEPTLNKAALLS